MRSNVGLLLVISVLVNENITAGAVRHGQRRANDGGADERRRRVRGVVPDISDAAAPHSIATSERTVSAACANSCTPSTYQRQRVVAHDWDRRADGTQGRQSGRNDVCGVRCVLDFVLRRQLRHGRLSVVPHRRAILQVVSVARLHVVHCESSHLHHFQPRIQTNIHPYSHL